MKKIRIKTPAKINLVLEILGKRADGFHEIQSIMQAVSLFDYLEIQAQKSHEQQIEVSGNSRLIPYDQSNITFKAADAFLNFTGIEKQEISIYIEKNIPAAAGLAGGSSNAAGVLWGLNKLYDNPLGSEELHGIASTLGSDVNFCLQGGTCSATSRGEILRALSTPDLKIVIAKPKDLFISAKEAYQRYSALSKKPVTKVFEQMKSVLQEDNPDKIASLLNNHLEQAIIPAYHEIGKLKAELLECGCKNALMSGSGSCVFGIFSGKVDLRGLGPGYEVFTSESISHGVIEQS